MSIATEVTYVDGVTVVSAAWLNLIQEHLAGWIKMQVTISGVDTVVISALPDDDAAVAYINGEQRINEADISSQFTGAEATNTYDVYIVGDGGGPGFTMEVVSGAPVGTNTRKIAEVDWDTTLDEITDLRVERGESEVHLHDLLDGSGEQSHAELADRDIGDDHTQYVLADGTRDFTSTVEGVTPVDPTDLATKGYSDGLLTFGVPTGTVVPYGGAAAPTGWLLCDGTSYPDATYPILAALLADAYGGDASNFNVPDMRGVFPYGKPTAGTGSSLGDTGGDLDHTHTQPTHTHPETGHVHTMAAHTHTSATTDTSPVHAHTQPATGSDGAHTHAGASHTHTSGSYSAGYTANASVGARHASAATAGLYAENDLDTSSPGADTLHDHGPGSYSDGISLLTGDVLPNQFDHTHNPSGNAHNHDHFGGAISGTTAAGTGTTSSSGAHTHSNPTTANDTGHTHTVGATDAAWTATLANTPGTTGADGNDTSDGANPPYLVVQYIIKHD